ncbi:MAG: hypothetical protein GY754_21610 [bacterium]|nr:hypothetical protein [bacterium]
MESGNIIFFNFFSVGSLIPLFFTFSMTYFFFTIKNRSKASLHLGAGFLFLGLFYVGYFIASSVYHPAAAFHRWLTAGFVFPAFIHLLLLFFYFPHTAKPRLIRIILVVLYAASSMLFAVFVFVSLKAERVFHLSAHYWDFDSDGISRFLAIVILLYLLLVLIAGTWRAIITKTGDRAAIISMTCAIAVTIIIPAVTNILSREGILDRRIYQVTQDLFTILGFFVMTVIYINNTKDKTTVMAKITGICFITLLVVFQGISFFSFEDKDDAYDSLCKKDIILALETSKKSPHIRYIASFSSATGESISNEIVPRSGSDKKIHIDFVSKEELLNTLMWRKIKNLNTFNSEDIGNRLAVIFNEGHSYFKGYEKAILEYIHSLEQNKTVSSQSILDRIQDLNWRIRYNKKKINKIPEEKFRENIVSYLRKQDNAFDPFQKVIISHIEKNNAPDTVLKKEVLRYLAPMNPAGVRNYRKDRTGMFHYISFTHIDISKGVIYEAGFSYENYRQYIHQYAYKLIIMLSSILLVMFMVFPFFSKQRW